MKAIDGLICSDPLDENLTRRKFHRTESHSLNFRAAAGSPKILADLISYSKRGICNCMYLFASGIKEIILPLNESLRVTFRQNGKL